MKKGQIVEANVERIGFPNKGIAVTEEGEQILIKNALPGQRIQARVSKKRKGKAEGTLLSVIEKAPNELAIPRCKHAGICGGCLYQSMDYDTHLQIKYNQVKELLYMLEDDVFEGVKPSPKMDGYRNKMEYSFGDEMKDGPLTLGMHKRGSFHDIVPVGDCRIACEDFGKILEMTMLYFRERKIPFFHKNTHKGYLRHLLLRRGEKTGEILVCLVTSTQTDELGCREEQLLEQWKTQLLNLPLESQIAGILQIQNDSLADAVINQGMTTLYGKDYFYEELLGLKFKITPFSFFQTNSLGAEVLYETARDFIGSAGDDKIVYDLYSGTGTIAQLMAASAQKVIGVEIVEEAVKAARENAKENHIENCEFIAGDVFAVLDNIEQKPDFLVVDPPREGVLAKALKKLLSYEVESLVYISCKPTSLARDLEMLLEAGYEVKRVCCVDMFPFTANIETCCLLERLRNAKDHVTFTLDMENYYRVKDAEADKEKR
ncbi:23S rRNA (uracil(1939)-C(5))-methyltransferase RlmD [Eubacterium oxidoreducens]|uniref:23S rRNA (Uracil-5-)-methyltransferase RumA n=1 Tax=Eubacterium oxidoreducens TaxID=1732 RepID=A0A1G6BAN1_EUBOX|nr:23S rRNA (uracil(1939)-C(5))-methyltransferase RlmD [Eubacterium oxidoreducens]SDB17660.1 23S rRNA (uracil-5-)-methyltransferase RumA [Eubacterium oxidoreducens]